MLPVRRGVTASILPRKDTGVTQWSSRLRAIGLICKVMPIMLLKGTQVRKRLLLSPHCTVSTTVTAQKSSPRHGVHRVSNPEVRGATLGL